LPTGEVVEHPVHGRVVSDVAHAGAMPIGMLERGNGPLEAGPVTADEDELHAHRIETPCDRETDAAAATCY